MTDDERFHEQRKAFRLFIATLKPEHLLALIEDINLMADYQIRMMDEFIDRKKFGEFMKAHWGNDEPDARFKF